MIGKAKADRSLPELEVLQRLCAPKTLGCCSDKDKRP